MGFTDKEATTKLESAIARKLHELDHRLSGQVAAQLLVWRAIDKSKDRKGPTHPSIEDVQRRTPRRYGQKDKVHYNWHSAQ